MSGDIAHNLKSILVCPNCGGSFQATDSGLKCSSCQSEYGYTKSGAIDLRLKQVKKVAYDIELGTPLLPDPGFRFTPLQRNHSAEIDYSGVTIPPNLSKGILSYFPKPKLDNSLMLDLGCGSTVHREVCEHAGFKYIGLDYKSDDAPILGDAHALPFKDESFEFILSVAVLEHIRFPFVMMREACRVLKPDGKFIGTVAFLEPFHNSSFYHHTHLGTYNSLQDGGFEITHIAPNETWSALIALADMVLFPKLPRLLSKLIIMPVQIAHRTWWKIGGMFSPEASDNMRMIYTAGSFTFIAVKTAAAGVGGF